MRAKEITGLLFLALYTGMGVAAFPQQPQQKSEARSTPAPVVSLSLSAVQDTVKAGSPVKVKATLANRSDHQITFGVAVLKPYAVEAWDSQGTLARETRLGAIRSGKIDPDQVGPSEAYDKYSVMTLKAGEKWTEEINVSDLYILDQPGEYRIQVNRYDSVGKAFVKSNAINITVVP
jgi:hypothetical protein